MLRHGAAWLDEDQLDLQAMWRAVGRELRRLRAHVPALTPSEAQETRR